MCNAHFHAGLSFLAIETQVKFCLAYPILKVNPYHIKRFLMGSHFSLECDQTISKLSDFRLQQSLKDFLVLARINFFFSVSPRQSDTCMLVIAIVSY